MSRHRAEPRRQRREPKSGCSTKLLSANDVWARFVLQQLVARVDRVDRMRALGFCVSVAHARFMARVAVEAGFRAVAVWADTPEAERLNALRDLADRRLNVVFSVDLFNEGVDVPGVDTVLLLRPSDSPTLFLQQLGRGLRRCHGKSVCTVLDFVGQHRAEFRFDRRFRALLGGSRRDLAAQIEAGFPFLPAGCHMELDRVAAEIVLRSVRDAVPGRWTERVDELRRLARDGRRVTLAAYLAETGIELAELYAGERGWSDLCADAGLPVKTAGPHERALRRACARLLHIDDLTRIEAYRALLAEDTPPDPAGMDVRQRRLLRMLVGPLVDKVATKSASLADGCAIVWSHPQVRAELAELLDVLAGSLAHVAVDLDGRPEVPLQVHARYSRIEILAAFGVGDGAKVAPWQTGVYRAEGAAADLLAFTLDKTSGAFSPTTRYRDYAVSRELIHWESQSSTRADSAPGRRYQQPDNAVMLFARLRSDDRAFSFLGPAAYVSHAGECPMAITWRLRHRLPGDLFAAFAAAVA